MCLIFLFPSFLCDLHKTPSELLQPRVTETTFRKNKLDLLYLGNWLKGWLRKWRKVSFIASSYHKCYISDVQTFLCNYLGLRI